MSNSRGFDAFPLVSPSSVPDNQEVAREKSIGDGPYQASDTKEPKPERVTAVSSDGLSQPADKLMAHMGPVKGVCACLAHGSCRQQPERLCRDSRSPLLTHAGMAMASRWRCASVEAAADRRTPVVIDSSLQTPSVERRFGAIAGWRSGVRSRSDGRRGLTKLPRVDRSNDDCAGGLPTAGTQRIRSHGLNSRLLTHHRCAGARNGIPLSADKKGG